MLDQKSRQRDFPSLTNRTYLNTAAEGISPLVVGEALQRFFRDKLKGMDGRPAHHAEHRALRELTAQCYGLTPDEIGICSCTSEAYNLAAMALDMREGDEVVVNDLEYPAGHTPWAQARCPATLKIWRSRNGALHLDDLMSLLSKRTRLVPMSLVSFYNGFMLRVPHVSEVVRKHSPALVSVDVTQALGRIPLDLTGADLILSSTHKWILGTHGGCLVGVPRHRADVFTAPAGGWFNLKDAFAPDRFDRPAVSQPGAASFSVGMPNFPACYANRAALGYILGVGIDKIHAHAQPLTLDCLRELKKFPVEMITPDDPDTLAGIIAFRHPKSSQLFDALHVKDIHVMHQAGRLRVSIHGYNTADDVERFLRTLRGCDLL